MSNVNNLIVDRLGIFENWETNWYIFYTENYADFLYLDLYLKILIFGFFRFYSSFYIYCLLIKWLVTKLVISLYYTYYYFFGAIHRRCNRSKKKRYYYIIKKKKYLFFKKKKKNRILARFAIKRRKNFKKRLKYVWACMHFSRIYFFFFCLSCIVTCFVKKQVVFFCWNLGKYTFRFKFFGKNKITSTFFFKSRRFFRFFKFFKKLLKIFFWGFYSRNIAVLIDGCSWCLGCTNKPKLHRTVDLLYTALRYSFSQTTKAGIIGLQCFLSGRVLSKDRAHCLRWNFGRICSERLSISIKYKSDIIVYRNGVVGIKFFLFCFILPGYLRQFGLKFRFVKKLKLLKKKLHYKFLHLVRRTYMWCFYCLLKKNGGRF